MPTWPATIPQYPDADQWVGGPQRNKVSFKPEVGTSIDRRRASAAGAIYQGVFSQFTTAQRATFETWFEDDLADGTLSFDWADPVTGVTATWKFTDEDPPYQFTAHGGYGRHSLSLRLMRLP
jgi:hypothetical protein